MIEEKNTILKNLADAVVNMDEEGTVRLAEEALAANIDAYEAINLGLSKGMEIVSEKYDREEYFVPEILICSDAMYAGLEVLKPHLKAESAEKSVGVVIGVIEGDIHDIGKNIVKIMLESAGFKIHDLGRDVSAESFVDKAVEEKALIIAVSTMMSTTMSGMKNVIDLLDERQIRDRFKVIIGGCPISESFSRKIGADGYGSNAPEAIMLAKSLGGLK